MWSYFGRRPDSSQQILGRQRLVGYTEENLYLSEDEDANFKWGDDERLNREERTTPFKFRYAMVGDESSARELESEIPSEQESYDIQMSPQLSLSQKNLIPRQ